MAERPRTEGLLVTSTGSLAEGALWDRVLRTPHGHLAREALRPVVERDQLDLVDPITSAEELVKKVFEGCRIPIPEPRFVSAQEHYWGSHPGGRYRLTTDIAELLKPVLRINPRIMGILMKEFLNPLSFNGRLHDLYHTLTAASPVHGAFINLLSYEAALRATGRFNAADAIKPLGSLCLAGNYPIGVTEQEFLIITAPEYQPKYR